MKNRTRKEFAEYLKMDVKKLADKIRYQEQKHNINYGTDFEDTKTYTEQEQYEICKLLEIPTFHVSVHNDTENFLSELNREKIKNDFEQLSELISMIDDVDFIRIDKNFHENLLKKLGNDFAVWYQNSRGGILGRDPKYANFGDIEKYLTERD
jgi:hypothetical protein